MNRPVSPLRAVWLLTRLHLIRMLNLVLAGFQKSGTRAGTAGKRTRGTSWLLFVFCMLMWGPGLVTVMIDTVSNVRRAVASRPVGEVKLDKPEKPERPRSSRAAKRLTGRAPTRIPLPALPGHSESEAMLTALALTLACAMAMALHGLLISPDLWRVEWSLEWLYTMPLGVTELFVVRTIASTLTNLAGFLMLAPLLGVMAWGAGWRWGAVPIALALAGLLLAVITTARQVLEVLLRLSLSPVQLRNVQAATTLGGFALWLPMMFVLGPGGENPLHPAWQWVRATPAAIAWTPPGLAIRLVASVDPGFAVTYTALLFAQCAALVAVGFWFLERHLAGGLLSGGSRESVRALTPAPAEARERWFLSAFEAKSLTLLARDRNLAVAVFGVPAFLILQQWLMGGSQQASVIKTPDGMGALAFIVGASAIVMALPQVLFKEFETYWFLQTFPRRTEDLFGEAAVFWCAALAVFPATALAVGIRTMHAPALTWLWIVALVAAGVVVFAYTAAALTILWSNPLSNDPAKRLSPTGAYLYMLLAGIYAQGLASGEPWHVLGGVTLASMLAYAFWQKATDHLPYLMDPAAAPPPRVSLSDGLIAGQIFFLLQALFIATRQPRIADVLVAFAAAGGVTCVLVLFTVWRQRMTGLPRVVGPGTLQAVGEGLLGGGIAALFGVAYLRAALELSPMRDVLVYHAVPPGADLHLALLGIVAAPLCEEFIFRGLVYTGLRRSLPRLTSILACSLLFAVLHPPIGLVPVFVMAVCASTVFDRTRLLIAPIVTHAVYNAAMVLLQAL